MHALCFVFIWILCFLATVDERQSTTPSHAPFVSTAIHTFISLGDRHSSSTPPTLETCTKHEPHPTHNGSLIALIASQSNIATLCLSPFAPTPKLSTSTQRGSTQVQADLLAAVAEHAFILLADQWDKKVDEKFIGLRCTASNEVLPSFWLDEVVPFLRKRWNIDMGDGKKKKSLQLQEAYRLFFKDELLIKRERELDIQVVIKEPELYYDFKQEKIVFAAYVCEYNKVTKMLTGDPEDKRERKRRKEQRKKRQNQVNKS